MSVSEVLKNERYKPVPTKVKDGSAQPRPKSYQAARLFVFSDPFSQQRHIAIRGQ